MGREGDVREGKGFEIRPGCDRLEEVIGRVRYDLHHISILGRCYLGTLDEPL